jgi:drug/metabolite transporter (DMT)-like permease
MEQKSHSLILGLATILLWGSLATFGKLLIHLPPFYILGASFFVGGLLSLRKPREIFQNLKVFCWGVGGFFGYHFFLFYAFRFAPAVEANLINYLWPIILVFLTPVFFPGDKLRWFHYLGATLAISGCVVLMSGNSEGSSGESLKGYTLAALAAITWPLYSLGKKKLPATSVWAIGGFCLGASFLCFVTHSLIEPRVSLQLPDALKLLFMGLGPFGLAFYFWDRALQIGDPKVLGALAYLTPVLSTLGLILFTEEILSGKVVVAMFLIIGGASLGLLDFLPRARKIERINHGQ